MATKKLRPLLLLEPLPGGLSLLAGFKVMAFPFCTKILALIGNGFELVFGKVFLRARPFESKMLSAMENETWKESDGNKRKKNMLSGNPRHLKLGFKEKNSRMYVRDAADTNHKELHGQMEVELAATPRPSAPCSSCMSEPLNTSCQCGSRNAS